MAVLLDNQLRKFISEHIGSVEQLEILFLLAGDPQKSWTVDEVFRTIQSNRESIEGRLKTFVAAGFSELDPAGGYRYKPTDQNMADCVSRLQAAYKESHVRVIEAIYSPIDPAQAFADSFKWKKDK